MLSTPKCLNCKQVRELHSGVKNNIFYENICLNCVGVIRSADFSRQYDRQWQRRHFAADLVQPTEKDYVKLRGEEAARKKGWTDSDLRKFG